MAVRQENPVNAVFPWTAYQSGSFFILSEGDCSEKQKVYIGFTQQKGNLAGEHENTQPCHPEGGEAESRDLGTEWTAKDNEMRRSFDSLTLAQDDRVLR